MSELRIGYAASNITPATPVELAGYGYNLGRIADEVADPLGAQVLAFSEGDTAAALCSIDTVGVGRDTVLRVQGMVQEWLKKDVLLQLHATHTHSGPATCEMNGLGGYNPGYVNNLVPRLAMTIVQAFTAASPGSLSIGRTEYPGYNYNRASLDAVDSRVTVFRAETQNGTVMVGHTACHPVVYGSTSRVVSGDFPAAARRQLALGGETVRTMWLTGSAGDLDPVVRRDKGDSTSAADVEALGKDLAAVAKTTKTGSVATGGLRTASGRVFLPVGTSFRLDPDKEIRHMNDSRLLLPGQTDGFEAFIRGVAPRVNGFDAEYIEVPVSVIRVGGIALVGMGAEIYTQTGLAIEAARPDLKVVTLMTTGDYQGYIAPKAEHDAGSYSTTHAAFFCGRKPLTPHSEQVLCSSVSGLLQKV